MTPQPAPSDLAAADVFAVDPCGIGGVVLRAWPGPARDAWLARLGASLALHRMPLHATAGRLLGGLDLAATLAAGRPVAERGLLVAAADGVLLAASAERMVPGIAALLGAALDADAARFGIVALDEGLDDDSAPAALAERLAVHLTLTDPEPAAPLADIAAARHRLAGVVVPEMVLEALCATAQALGVGSLRAAVLALRVARAAAALAGRTEVADADAALAARLVLAPRATRLPAPPAPPEPPQAAEPPPPSEQMAEEDGGGLEDRLIQATQAAIPPGLLATLASAAAPHPRGQGGSGATRAGLRGRPAGTRAGDPRGGARLALVETLRAAAPWQRLRGGGIAGGAGVAVRRQDFRVHRLKQRTQTVTIFVVDASGSTALNRLAEAKGAVELLLAQCYVRRDQVALLAFRGAGADLLLPPTGSLTRARRSLAGLPGGGGTPLAAAIDAAAALAEQVQRRGQSPLLVFLTDGRANIARDGRPDRAKATEQALQAAGKLRAAAFATVLVDTSPRPQTTARQLAVAMGARCLPLPYADAAALSRAVQAGAG